MTPEQSKRSNVILLAEDDDDHFLLIQNAFKAVKSEEDLFRVVNGVELMNYLDQQRGVASEERLKPRMIILDLNLPKKDGREVLKELKSSAQYQDIPVAILTTSINEEDKFNSYHLGAEFFIRKPILYKEYVEIMRKLKECWSQH